MAGIKCFPTALNQDRISVNTLDFFKNQMRHLHSPLTLSSQTQSSGHHVSQLLVPTATLCSFLLCRVPIPQCHHPHHQPLLSLLYPRRKRIVRKRIVSLPQFHTLFFEKDNREIKVIVTEPLKVHFSQMNSWHPLLKSLHILQVLPGTGVTVEQQFTERHPAPPPTDRG